MYARCIIFVSIYISRTIQEVAGANYGQADNPGGLDDVDNNPNPTGNNNTTYGNPNEKKALRNAHDETQYDSQNDNVNNPNQYDIQYDNGNDPNQYDNQYNNGNDPDQYDNQNNNGNDPDQYDSQYNNGYDPDQYEYQNNNGKYSDQYDNQYDNGNYPDQYDNQYDNRNDPDQYDNQYDNGNYPNQNYNENGPDQYDSQNYNSNDPDVSDIYSDTDEIGVPPSDESMKYAERSFDFSQDEMLKLKLWPDGFIPYYIDVYSFSDKVMRDKIRSFLSSVNSLTALNFVEIPSPPSDNSRWVFFVNRRGLLGCADHSIRNFTNEGVQQVVLGYHCMSNEGELAEAVLSIAGVPAQHNSPDRDYYVKIKEENIIPEKKYLFLKRFDNEWLFHDLEYDFHSAGHFHSYKHSINGRATVIPQRKLGPVILGESTALSATDIKKLRMLYNYIAKKKSFVAPDCAKLFEPGDNFDAYKPGTFKLAPRPKPYQYIGESVDAPLDSQDIEMVPGQSSHGDQVIQYTSSVKPDIFTYSTVKDIQNIIVPNEHQTPNQQPTNVENPNDVIYNPVDDDNYDNAKNNQISQTSEELVESDNSNPNNYQSDDSIRGKTPSIVHLDPSTSAIVKLHGLTKGKKHKDGPDPLTVWSDFHTDEEKNERKKPFQNLALQGKTDLKFKVGR